MMNIQNKFLTGNRVEMILEDKPRPVEKDCEVLKDSMKKQNDSEWLIKDIVEKDPKKINLTNDSCILADNTNTGFPVPKKLSWKSLVTQYEESNKRMEKEFLLSEKINEENMQMISRMTPEEIKNAKEELMTSLEPQLIEKLMQKKGLDKDVDEVMNKQNKKVQFLCPEQSDLSISSTSNVKEQELSSSMNIHFPKPPPFQDLDPSSPDFFERLHSKYFPDLPVDPSKLAWMTTPTKAEDEMEYHESMLEITPESIRFDFNGNILSPRISRQIPGYIGLHHHASAPLAAGYSIPELAHLSRSTFSAQRCIAILVLGRILYKLSKYVYGSEVTDALKKVVEKSNVMESLIEAASEKTRHLSVKAYAEEALYLAHCELNNTT